MASRAPDAAADAVSETASKMLCLGIIGAPHGVRGAMKVKTFTEVPEDLAAYGPLTDKAGERVFVITSCQAAKGGARVTLQGVNDRSAAEALKNTGLYVARDKLPNLEAEDDFYHSDLIGLIAVDGDGQKIGRIVACHNFGAGDLLELMLDKAQSKSKGKTGGTNAFYPFTKAVVPEVNMVEGYVTLIAPQEDEARPPQNMADDEKDADQ